ncbi:MAG: prolipoprotein diacylglyceryl transferase [Chitinophagales bacterium]|nr:prolipoprotein diacylglyceryl transferase [Chitinophagales bacterium]
MDLLLGFIEWKVKPEITEVLGYPIRYYSLMFGIAFFLGYYIIERIFKFEKKNLEDLDALLMTMFLSTVIGARLGHCLFYDFHYYFVEHPLEIIQVWEGGLASHGAAIGILLGLYLFQRKHPYYSYLWVVDRIVIVVALAGVFIRIGNFFNHEIVGIVDYNSPFSVIFHHNTDEPDNMHEPRIPIQLFESFSYLILFVILLVTYLKKNVRLPDGLLLGMFLIGCFGARIVNEIWKDSPIVMFGLKNGQLLSIPLVLIGVVLVVLALSGKTRRVEA